MTSQQSPTRFCRLPGAYVFSGTIEPRILFICGLSVLVGFVVAWIAKVLLSLIGLVTNVAFYGRLSLEFSSPSHGCATSSHDLFIQTYRELANSISP